MPTTAVSPSYAIVPAAGSQQYTLANAPSGTVAWSASPSSAVSWSPMSAGLATVQAQPGAQVTITATISGVGSWSTMMTVAPEGSLLDRNTLVASTNGTVYLVTEIQQSFLASPIILADNGCPEFILQQNGGVPPWGLTQPSCQDFPQPGPVGLTYLTCVVVNLQATPVGDERRRHAKK